MKKVYLVLTVALLSGLITNAQFSRSVSSQGKQQSKIVSHAARHAAPTQTQTLNSNSIVIWSNDFSNASDWTMSTGAGAATTDNWTIGSIGPTGTFPIDPIATTGDFALYDSDLMCSGNQIGQMTNATAIDLTGHANVRLTFAQYYRKFLDSTYVYVSNDGTNWTRFIVNGTIAANEFSAEDGTINPNMVDFDISSVAGNQATVYIRFEFFSPTSLGVGSGCGYSWMVDDVAISDIPQVDAAVIPNESCEYSWVPITQPEAFELRGRFVNRGVDPIMGQIIFNVSDINGVLFTDTSVVSTSVNPGDTSGYLGTPNQYLPPVTGDYTIDQTIYVTNDGDGSNDVASLTITVADNAYGRDLSSVGTLPLKGGFGANGQTCSLGQIYETWHASYFIGGDVFFATDSPNVGNTYSLELYDIVSGLPSTSLATSGVLTITAADTGWKSIAFTAPVAVAPGEYALVLNQLDVNNITLGFSGGIFTPGKAIGKIGAGTWAPLEPQLTGAWLLLAANFDITLKAKQDLATSQFSVYPNPSQGFIYVAGNNEKNVTVEVTNSIGQVVKTVKFDELNIDRIDLQNVPAGMYNVHIQSEKGKVTKSIVLN